MTQQENESDERLRRALVAMHKLRSKMDEAEYRDREPIAIVGMACRFPGGANTPDSLWSRLCAGADAVADVPKQRWDVDAFYHPEQGKPGKINARAGGFLDGEIDRFDNRFFGISPREACAMDPQQRLLLEVTWEALENAGMPIDQLAGALGGVFMGINTHDYSMLQVKQGRIEELDFFTATGNSASVATGRLSYLLGLHGPNLAIDTACSSSLVCVHLAAQSLRAGECRFALVGGVNLILAPETSVAIASGRAMSAAGRCKTFDASADGYVRGEGCGVIVLKRLSDALADNDEVLAVVLGSAVNHGGHSSGLTVPNGDAQAMLIRQALANGHVAAHEVSYVEAHGTGTALGDPIELQALGEVLGRADCKRPLKVGSIKSNLGHLEAAAGIAGIIKIVLSLQHRTLTPTLHVEVPTPLIEWQELGLEVADVRSPWRPRSELPEAADASPRLVAGVSSFGIGGTNAHVLLAEPSELALARGKTGEESPPRIAGPQILTLSAKDPEALKALARGYAERLRSVQPGELRDLLYTSSVRRAHHGVRLAAVGPDAGALAAVLEAFLAGAAHPDLSVGDVVGATEPSVSFAYPGIGGQWAGMALDLLEDPIFADTLEAIDGYARPHLGYSILDCLRSAREDSAMIDVALVQPLIFAVQLGLSAVFRHWGVEPDAVLGASMGEVAAAHVAGALDLAEATRVCCIRSRVLSGANGVGAMAALALSEAEADELLAAHRARVSIAAINGRRSVVVSGDEGVLDQLVAQVTARGVFARKLGCSVAAHSPQVEPLLPALAEQLAQLDVRVPATPLFSTVTGEEVGERLLDAAYWCRNMRAPVRLADALTALAQGGSTIVLELSPNPVIGPALTGRDHGTGVAQVIASGRKQQPERQVALRALGALYCAGYRVDWKRVHGVGRLSPLPNYPWQRERFWFQAHARPARASAGDASQPLFDLATTLAEAAERRLYQTTLSPDRFATLRGARASAYPASLQTELAFAAARDIFGSRPFLISDWDFRAWIPSDDAAAVTVQLLASQRQTSAEAEATAVWDLKLMYRAAHGAAKWEVGLLAILRPRSAGTAAYVLPESTPERIQERCTEHLTAAEYYERAVLAGFRWPSEQRVICRIWRREGEALLELATRPGEFATGVLDACFHALACAVPRHERSLPEGNLVPTQVLGIRADADPGRRIWLHAQVRSVGPSGVTGEVHILDDVGGVLAQLTELALGSADRVCPQLGSSATGGAAPGAAVPSAPEPTAWKQDSSARIAAQVARVLGLPVEQLPLDRALPELGMNSVMVFDLRNWLRLNLDVTLPMTFFSSGRFSAHAIAQQVEQLLSGATSADESAAALATAPKAPPLAPKHTQEKSVVVSAPRAGALSREPTSDDGWFSCPRPRRAPAMRLYCFTPAGSGPSIYTAWHKGWPEHVELRVLNLPGRENRQHEPPLTRLTVLLRELVQAMEREPKGPFAFYGHSFGALVAFELTRALRARGLAQPHTLYVAARPAPHLPNRRPPIHRLTAEELIQAIRSFGGTPEAILRDVETFSPFIPAIRGDFAMLETHLHKRGDNLECPIVAFGGTSDLGVAQEDLDAWRSHTDAGFQLCMFPEAGHFFLSSHREQLTRVLSEYLERSLALRAERTA